MMSVYLGGQPVTLAFALSENGAANAQSIEYRVLNEDQVELVAKTTVSDFVAASTEVTIAISGLLNTISAGKNREARIVEVYATLETGVIKLVEEYFIEVDEIIVAGENSFQTYAKALMTSMDIPNLPYWNGADKRERVSALVAARRSMGALRFRYTFDRQDKFNDSDVNVGDITLLTANEYAALPAQFKEALCRAQVVEADDLLGGNEVRELRESGLISKTVGESKHFFRTIKPIETPICRRALKELSKWILSRIRIGKA